MIKKTISLIALMLTCPLGAGALDINDFIKPANPLEQTTQNETIIQPAKQKAVLTKNDIHNQYAIALNRFIQSNVKASYMDFLILIESSNPTDYVYMSMSEKMADLGFFDLSELAMSKINDENISYLLTEDVKKYYFPSTKIVKEDEIYLAEMYSNIIYNEQSKEVVAELTKNTKLLDKYDYANYIAALGCFKANDIENAQIYINTAISRNPQNINYKKLKAEILSQTAKPKDAIKVLDSIKSENMGITYFKNKIDSCEQYILYKTTKNEFDKKYYLAHYFYLEGELNKSMRTLQASFNTKKNHNKKIYALLSRVYYDLKEYEKAEDNATKTLKMDKSNKIALDVLGDLAYKNKDYKTAAKYYKNIKTNDSEVKLAQCYINMDDTKKATEILSKVLKNSSDCYLAYYNVALLDKSRETAYLKKSVAINYNYSDGWIDLARVELEKNRPDSASEYLSIAKMIDENNFRYHYYQGILFKSKGLTADAKRSFMKSVKLNPDFKPAKEELSI